MCVKISSTSEKSEAKAHTARDGWRKKCPTPKTQNKKHTQYSYIHARYILPSSKKRAVWLGSGKQKITCRGQTVTPEEDGI